VAGFNPWLFPLILTPVVFNFIGLMILGFGSTTYPERRAF